MRVDCQSGRFSECLQNGSFASEKCMVKTDTWHTQKDDCRRTRQGCFFNTDDYGIAQYISLQKQNVITAMDRAFQNKLSYQNE